MFLLIVGYGEGVSSITCIFNFVKEDVSFGEFMLIRVLSECLYLSHGEAVVGKVPTTLLCHFLLDFIISS